MATPCDIKDPAASQHLRRDRHMVRDMLGFVPKAWADDVVP